MAKLSATSVLYDVCHLGAEVPGAVWIHGCHPKMPSFHRLVPSLENSGGKPAVYFSGECDETCVICPSVAAGTALDSGKSRLVHGMGKFTLVQ